MSRSDKVPFRREFTLTASGYAGSVDGFYVGDIMSLHIDLDSDDTDITLEGRTHTDGPWTVIHSNGESTGEDIRAWEYVRLYVLTSSSALTTKIVLFGYDLPIDKDVQVVSSDEKELKMKIKSTDRLDEIYKQLIKLNEYMEIITGERL